MPASAGVRGYRHLAEGAQRAAPASEWSMQREYRLTKGAQFRQVRAAGRSWGHPLMVLYAHRSGEERTRFGFSVSKRVGNAVVRNRVKRRLREAARQQRPHLEPGWDILLIARPAIAETPYQQVAAALDQLVRRARLRRDVA